MVNIYNRRLAFSQCPEPGLINCVLPFAPLNTLSMLHDYIQPEQRWVACPNQDVAWLVDTSAGREEEITFRVGSCGFVDRVFVSREVFEFT
jgi:hypothetical protein